MNALTRFFGFFLVTVLLAACSTTKPLTMEMALKEGTNFDYAITSTNKMSMSMLGQDMSTDMKSTQDYNFMVKKIQPTGITELDFKIDRLAVDISIPMMGDMNYDSSNKSEASNSPLKNLGGFVGKTMTASMNKKGQVTEVEGADVLFKEVLAKMKNGDQVANMLESYIGEEAFINAFSNLTGFAQGKALKVGDSWTQERTLGAGVSFESDYTYTIKERSGGKVTIDVTGQTKSDPNAAPIEAQGVKISYDLSGPITGVIVVDEKTGWAITSDIQQDLSGKLKMGGTPMGDMNLDAKMKIGVSAKRK